MEFLENLNRLLQGQVFVKDSFMEVPTTLNERAVVELVKSLDGKDINMRLWNKQDSLFLRVFLHLNKENVSIIYKILRNYGEYNCVINNPIWHSKSHILSIFVRDFIRAKGIFVSNIFLDDGGVNKISFEEEFKNDVSNLLSQHYKNKELTPRGYLLLVEFVATLFGGIMQMRSDYVYNLLFGTYVNEKGFVQKTGVRRLKKAHKYDFLVISGVCDMLQESPNDVCEEELSKFLKYLGDISYSIIYLKNKK